MVCFVVAACRAATFPAFAAAPPDRLPLGGLAAGHEEVTRVVAGQQIGDGLLPPDMPKTHTGGLHRVEDPPPLREAGPRYAWLWRRQLQVR